MAEVTSLLESLDAGQIGRLRNLEILQYNLNECEKEKGMLLRHICTWCERLEIYRGATVSVL